MAERTPFRDSVFARLVVVMAAMAFCLLLVVGGFFWFLGGPSSSHGPMFFRGAHISLVTSLLIVISAVVLTAHTVLRRMLGPLRDLSAGVTRLGAGDLDVELQARTRDEFGSLAVAFNQMVGRVRGMIASRDQLLLDVSHELRSPLARMKVALELLPPGQRPRGMAEDIAEMDRMIGELLELERLRSGHGIVRRSENLAGVVRDAAAAFAHLPPGVEVVSAPDSVLAEIDAEKVRAVLRNLIENAVKYSGPTAKPVEIEVTTEDSAVIVRVRDFGPGIPDADRDRIFEPFFRVDRSRTRATGGFGLGLSLCRRVMDAHGGQIRLASPASGGATFVLTFPRG